MSTDKYSLTLRDKEVTGDCIGISGGVEPKQLQSESLTERKIIWSNTTTLHSWIAFFSNLSLSCSHPSLSLPISQSH